MKITPKQANLLAKEVVRQLSLKKVNSVSELTKAKIQQWADKKKELQRKVEEAENEVKKHGYTLFKLVGVSSDNVYGSNPVAKAVQILEDKNLPSVTQVENEIILKSMFATEIDMQKFIDGIVSKYSKKIQSKVSVN